MLSTIGKSVIAGAVTALSLGFGANQAAADSFSVSVHTPGVSAGYSDHRGHDRGYVQVYSPPPPPVARPAWGYPVVVERPVVVVQPRHVCSWDRVPVTRMRYDDWGRRIHYTDYVKVRVCDDYHRRHDHGHYVKYDHHKHGHQKHYKYDDDHRNKHGKHHDRDDDRRYSRNWDDDDRHDRHDNHRGRDRD